MISVSIIGVGRVGGALALALPRDLYYVENLVYRSDESTAVDIGALTNSSTKKFIDVEDLNSDIIFITTQDAEIACVSSALAAKLSGKPCVFHTSGAALIAST